METRTIVLIGGIGALAYTAYKNRGTGGRPWQNGGVNPNWRPSNVDEDILTLKQPPTDWLQIAVAQKFQLAAVYGAWPSDAALGVIPQMYAWDGDELIAVWLQHLYRWYDNASIGDKWHYLELLSHLEMNLQTVFDMVADRVGLARTTVNLAITDKPNPSPFGLPDSWPWNERQAPFTFMDYLATENGALMERDEIKALWYAIEFVANELMVAQAFDPSYIDGFMDSLAKSVKDAPRVIGDIASRAAIAVGKAGGLIGGGLLAGLMGGLASNPVALIGGAAIIYWMVT